MVAAASARVLEVGVGSGLNFPLYGKQVEIVFGIDPSPRLLAIAATAFSLNWRQRTFCRKPLARRYL